MKNLSLIASALAMLGLTACEKGLVDGVADVAPAGQAANSVLQVRTRSGGSAGGEATVAVDTHVFRVSHRLGLVPDSCTTPLSVEQMLTKHFKEEEIPDAHHWLILHGRYTCTALRPKCNTCGLTHLCKEYKKKHL